MKAYDAWQRRKVVNEIETKKNLHVASLYSIVEWKESGDQQEAIEHTEKYYDLLKEYIWEPDKADRENKEMQELENSDPFLKASKRNFRKIVAPSFPNQEKFEELIDV